MSQVVTTFACLQVGFTCNCDVNDVTFECGSIRVSVEMDVPDYLNITKLKKAFRFQSECNNLPPYDVDVESVTVALALQGKNTWLLLTL